MPEASRRSSNAPANIKIFLPGQGHFRRGTDPRDPKRPQRPALPAGIGGERLAERFSIDELTAREREVLQLLAQGLSDRQIAERLPVAEQSVRIHVSSILDKMQVADGTQAVTTAIQRGLLHIE